MEKLLATVACLPALAAVFLTTLLGAGLRPAPVRQPTPKYQFVGTWRISWAGVMGTCEIHANGTWVHHFSPYSDWAGTWKQTTGGLLEIRERYVAEAGSCWESPWVVYCLPLKKCGAGSYAGRSTGGYDGVKVILWP